jgi:methionyl-tRNA formyltransferase
MGADTLLKCVQRLASGKTMNAVAQDDNGVTYAAKLQKAEAEIDWRLGAVVLERTIRAFNPWPVAWCDLCGERTRVWAARALAVTSKEPPGTIVATGPEGIDIATGGGLLRLLRLQRPGGRQISAAEYLNARPLMAAASTRT